MANPNKAKGTLFETQVTKYLNESGVPAVKPRQAGRYDVGDIWVEDDLILQAKAWKDLASAVRVGTAASQLQAGYAHRAFGASVVKRANANVKEAYVVMPLHAFTALLKSRQSPCK